jgi:adenosylcobinamide-GDP ribazoletransferase
VNLHWWAFWYAMAFLTRLPTPYLKRVDDAVAARSLVFYPLVGALLGLCLLAFTAACVFYNPQVSLLLLAALLLFIWVVFSGALHLDGLADSADAWVGGLGNKERTLAIMKDPQSGPMGVTVIAVILLVKFAAIYALLDKAQSGSGSWNIWLLIAGFMLVPMLARGAVPGLLATTPYVRKKGLASALGAGATPLVVGITGTLLALLAGVFLQTQALFILALWLTILMMARAAMIKRLGGCTGDTLGATIEIQEALLLAAIAL